MKRLPLPPFILPPLLLALLAGGCAERFPGPKATVGAIGGSAAGGLIAGAAGGGAAGIAAGSILGGALGLAIGNELDSADRRLAQQAAQDAFEHSPPGRPVGWNNEASGTNGAIRPGEAYQTRDGRSCRDFQQIISVKGKAHRSQGTACRQPDGSWKVQG